MSGHSGRGPEVRLVLLSGGVGGARMARGLAASPRCRVTVVVNTGDDDIIHGLYVSPDLDTVVYTLAGLEGPEGWGRADEEWTTMDELARFEGADTSFRLGNRDLALNLYRSGRLMAGDVLSAVTADVVRSLGIDVPVVPMTDERVRTVVRIADGELDFQTYFVRRRHRDRIEGVVFHGAAEAVPTPGVLEEIAAADAVLIAPSNPVLSVWPILAIPGYREALSSSRVVAVSPLIGGRAVKGPAVEALRSAGLTADTAGIVDAYPGLLDGIVVDTGDADTVPEGLPSLATDTFIASAPASERLAEEIVAWMG